MTSGRLVSVVLPTHNRADVLARSVSSVLRQTYSNFELIIVDDGSTDETSDVLEDIRTGDRRVRLISLPTAGGAAYARNAGWQAARGEWIAFQDSDDEWVDDKLERQIDAASPSTAANCVHFARYSFVEAKGVAEYPRGSAESLTGFLNHRLLEGNVLSLQTTLLRAQLLRNVGGFDDQLRRFQDWDLALRLSRVAQFRLLDTSLARVYADLSDRISLRVEIFREAARRLLANEAMRGASRPELAQLAGALARQAVSSGHPSAERDLRIYAARRWPSPRAMGAVVRAMAPGELRRWMSTE